MMAMLLCRLFGKCTLWQLSSLSCFVGNRNDKCTVVAIARRSLLLALKRASQVVCYTFYLDSTELIRLSEEKDILALVFAKKFHSI